MAGFSPFSCCLIPEYLFQCFCLNFSCSFSGLTTNPELSDISMPGLLRQSGCYGKVVLLSAVFVSHIFNNDVKNMLYTSLIFVIPPFPLSRAHQKAGGSAGSNTSCYISPQATVCLDTCSILSQVVPDSLTASVKAGTKRNKV